jgi:hypothetical protein
LIQVKGVIVVNGSPQKVPEVANPLIIGRGGCGDPCKLGERLGREVGE